MNATNDKIADAVGKICDRFDEIFSSHTEDHNKVVSKKIDRIFTEGDFQVDFECFNNISPYQLGILKMLFLANGYRVVECQHDRWTARIDFVEVGVDLKLLSPSLEIFKV